MPHKAFFSQNEIIKELLNSYIENYNWLSLGNHVQWIFCWRHLHCYITIVLTETSGASCPRLVDHFRSQGGFFLRLTPEYCFKKFFHIFYFFQKITFKRNSVPFGNPDSWRHHLLTHCWLRHLKTVKPSAWIVKQVLGATREYVLLLFRRSAQKMFDLCYQSNT